MDVVNSNLLKAKSKMKLVALQFVMLGLVGCYDDGSVLLRDIQALTLYRGRYTTARRSTPVPQLKCVGGSAGCHAFIPEVVQCVNKGWDGVDVQWECRTDMDHAYKFGYLEVSCEGYSHPTDAYVLKGSCGLEYKLEVIGGGQAGADSSWTSQTGFGGFGGFGGLFSSFFGNRKQQQRHHHHHHQQQQQQQHLSGSEDSGGLLGVAVLLLLGYGVYKLFLCGNTAQWGQEGATEYPRDDIHGDAAGPPPPGFKPDFTGYPGGSPGYSDHTHRHQDSGGWGRRGNASSPPGGFWSGMGAGGLLGYLFGNRNQPYHYSSYSHRSPTPLRQPTSSGTRTTSGFGGTKRR